MDKENILQKMRAQRFIENNGRVLRSINVLRQGYIRLTLVFATLEQSDAITEAEFLDSVHFLAGNNYIALRTIAGREPIADITDMDYRSLEAIVTPREGIRLLAGKKHDDMVDLEAWII